MSVNRNHLGPAQASTLVDVLEWRAEHQGGRDAFTFLTDGDEASTTITYAQLHQRARAVAAELHRRGVADGRVLLVLPPGLDYIASFLGCLYAGCTAVPCLPISARLHRFTDRIRTIARDCEASAVIGPRASMDGFRSALENESSAPALNWLAVEDARALGTPDWRRPATSAEGLAFLQYTSGSTGTPKGTMVSHGNVMSNCQQIDRAFELDSESRLVSWLPPHHDMGLIGCILTPLFAGVPCLFMTPQAFVQKPVRWLRAISKFRATVSGGPNFAYEHCARRVTPEACSNLDLSSWSLAFVGAEPVREQTLLRFTEAFSARGFRHHAFYPCYGLAEATLFVSGGRVEAPPTVLSLDRREFAAGRATRAAEGEIAARWVSCGTGQGASIAIVEPDALKRVEEGQIGEIWVNGPHVAQGYWRRDDEREAVFAARMADGEGPFLRTGDLGAWVDGELLVVGRRKDLIIVRGQNYHAHDIERAAGLSNTTALVPDGAAAFSIERDDEERIVVVHEVSRKARTSDLDALITSIRRAISEEFDLALHTVVLIPQGALPRTSSGKVRRPECREQYEGGRLDGLARWDCAEARSDVGMDIGAAREGVLDRLATAFPDSRTKILSEYVVMSVAQAVGPTDCEVVPATTVDALNLDSLRVVSLVQTWERDLGLRLALADVYSCTTLGDVAALLERASTGVKPGAPRHPALALTKATQDELNQPFPLTDVQGAYWAGRMGGLQYGGVSCHGYLELDCGCLDLELFASAWRRLIERHPMLRAVVASSGEQRILARVEPYQIAVHDFRGLDAEEAQSRAVALRERISHQVLPADAWPLFHVSASLLPGGTTRIHLGIDLLIADVHSLRILFQELERLYHQPSTHLEPLDVTFQDCVLTELRAQDGERYREDREYWIDRVPTLPSGPEFPLLAARSKEPTRFCRRSSTLVSAAWERLKRRAREAGLTPSGVLMAAYATVIARWARRPQFLLNVTLSRRLPVHAQVESIVGDFTSVDLLDAHLRADDSFLTFALRLRDQLRKDLGHGSFSGVRVAREITRGRGTLTAPIAPVVFTSSLGQGASGEPPPLARLGTIVYAVSQTPQVWLDHQVHEVSDALELHWDAVDALFPDGVLDDMFASYGSLLQTLADDPAFWQRHLTLPLPAGQQARRLALNATSACLPRGLLQDGFETQAKVRPEQPAVICGNTVQSYAEVARRAAFVGDVLHAAGAQVNELVAVAMEKGWEQVVGVLGVLHAGAAYVPLDPDLPGERLEKLLRDAQVRFVLTQSRVSRRVAWPSGVVVHHVDEMDAPPDHQPRSHPRQQPNDLAYVIYTSGSTGAPKGVVIDHGTALNTIADINSRFSVDHRDRVFGISSLSFDLSVYDVFGTLAAGGTLVLPDPDKLRDPAHWLSLVREQGVTVWNSVPALMQMVVEHEAESLAGSIPSLRLAMLSGDWIPVALPARIARVAPRAEVVSLGGATECGIWSIAHPIDRVETHWTSIPYGRPLANQRFHVLDDALRDCPEWVTGELYIGGAGLAKGYWRDEEMTAQKFIVRPHTGERLYRTGDLGRLCPTGHIEFQGRNDFQVKIHGYRVEMGEVEWALSRCAGVRTAAVAVTGEGAEEKRLVAYVVPDAGTVLSARDIQAGLRTQLPGYMVPSRIVMLEALPLTSNGKVDVNALRRLEIAEGAGDRPACEAPRTQLEERVADIWSGVLSLEQARPGVHDNFFEVGGDSLMVLRLLREIRREFDVEVELREFFANPTIDHLGQVLSGGHGSMSDAVLVPMRRLGSNVPLFCVPAADGSVLLFKQVVEELGAEQPFYGFQLVTEAEQDQPVAIEEIARRNVEALRKVQPRGPYRLAGYCWGCTVALEMAHQLRAQGEAVERLVLVDPLHPDYYGYFIENPVLLIGLLAQVMNPMREVDLMPVETLQGMSLDDQLVAAHRDLSSSGLLLPVVGLDQFKSHFSQFRNNLRALVEYRSPPYSGSAALFVVDDYPPEWQRYWQALVARLEVVQVRGTHYSIWTEPTASRVFARQLLGALGSAHPGIGRKSLTAAPPAEEARS